MSRRPFKIGSPVWRAGGIGGVFSAGAGGVRESPGAVDDDPLAGDDAVAGGIGQAARQQRQAITQHRSAAAAFEQADLEIVGVETRRRGGEMTLQYSWRRSAEQFLENLRPFR